MKTTALDHLNAGVSILKALVKRNRVGDGPEFRQALDELEQAQCELQLQFGFTVATACRSRGTQAECETFAISLDLPKTDGEWFWVKMEGSGWKNAGRKMADWRMTLRAWKLAGLLPSQKWPGQRNGNGNGAAPVAKVRTRFQLAGDMQMIEKRIKAIHSSHGRTWSAEQNCWIGPKLPPDTLETCKKLRLDIKNLQAEFDKATQ